MVEGARAQRGLLAAVPWEIISLLVALAISLAMPLQRVEEHLRALQLDWAGPSEAPLSAVALVVQPGPDCTKRIGDTLRDSSARVFVLLPPVETVCPGAAGQLKGAVSLAPDALLQVRDRIVGLSDPSALHPKVPAGWVAPYDFRAVPTLQLSKVNEPGVGAEFLDGRIVVLGLDRMTGASSPEKVAAALAAGRTEGTRPLLPPGGEFFTLGLFAILGVYATRWGRRIPLGRSGRQGAVVLILGSLISLAALSQIGAFGAGFLYPLARAAVCVFVAATVGESRALIAERHASLRALALLEEAYHRKTAGLSQESNAAFWARLASRAAQAHPANEVLVAELPSHQWHLTIWPHGSVDDSIIKERRRDIRRTPYSDERGVPTITLTRTYLRMKDWPALLVPMIAGQDIEGYLMLLGPDAEDEYKRAPERAERVAQELAALARRRRLALQGTSEDAQGPVQLLDKTRGMLEELGLMTALFENAPVGLLYADSFGDVRLIGRELEGLLSGMGIPLPASSEAGLLESGALPLAAVLRAFSPDKNLGDVSASGIELDTRGTDAILHLSVKAIYGHDGGLNGYVASVTRVTEASNTFEEEEGGTLTHLPVGGQDPLTVFSATELMSELLAEAAEMGHTQVRLQTPRTHGTSVAHLKKLRQALRDFVLDVSERTIESNFVVTVEELEGTVEIRFLDIQLGVPSGAIRRAFAAPSIPPPGLGSLGALAKAVEDGHGRARAESDSDWGTSVIVELVRARPRVSSKGKEAGPVAPSVTLKRT